MKFLLVLELRRMLDVPDFSLIGLDEIESGRHVRNGGIKCLYVRMWRSEIKMFGQYEDIPHGQRPLISSKSRVDWLPLSRETRHHNVVTISGVPCDYKDG